MGSGGGGGSNVIVWRYFHFHAKALMFTAVLLQLLGSSRGSYRTPPQSAQNGLYKGFMDENGEKQLKYVGTGNATHPKEILNCPSHSASEPRTRSIDIDIGGPGLLGSTHTHCRGDLMNIWDVQVALNCLAHYFNNGADWEDVIAYKQNAAYAFGCDYGLVGQWATAAMIWQDADFVNDDCGGWGWSGSYYHEDVYAAYGRCPTDKSIC